MKKFIIFSMASMLWTSAIFSQIKKATLQASGLTCALCAKSIFTNLSALAFVDSVDTDLESSSFLIFFKPSGKIDLNAIKMKVEDAGFFVAKLMLKVESEHLVLGVDKKLRIGDNVYHIVDIKDPHLHAPFEMRIIDQGFLSAKDLKKISSSSKLPCYQSKNSLPCTIPVDAAGALGIYHVAL